MTKEERIKEDIAKKEIELKELKENLESIKKSDDIIVYSLRRSCREMSTDIEIDCHNCDEGNYYCIDLYYNEIKSLKGYKIDENTILINDKKYTIREGNKMLFTKYYDGNEYESNMSLDRDHMLSIIGKNNKKNESDVQDKIDEFKGYIEEMEDFIKLKLN